MALAALVRRARENIPVKSATLVGLGVFGASLFHDDSVIAPAISVLSAVQGLLQSTPAARLVSRRARSPREASATGGSGAPPPGKREPEGPASRARPHACVNVN
jgi:hypothetical protein